MIETRPPARAAGPGLPRHPPQPRRGGVHDPHPAPAARPGCPLQLVRDGLPEPHHDRRRLGRDG